MEDRGKRIGQLEQKMNALHSKVNKIQEDVLFIKQSIIELNLKVPRRTKGYLWNSWDDSGQDEAIRNFNLKK